MSKKLHFIAIGGSAMHNLALALHDMGHKVTGSDDEIYEPSRSRLASVGILPKTFGWHPDKITQDLDAVILGMHARPDNPELYQAQKLGIPIYSYPEYVALQSQGQKQIVIAGSHGKTTTTAIIMHVLRKLKVDFDYLVGAQLDGFDRMVRLYGAPIIILEGDEYLSSPIDRRPKMMHYNADITVITGVAWDHINVFPTFEVYEDQFRKYITGIKKEGVAFYYANDDSLIKIVGENKHSCRALPYGILDHNEGLVTCDGNDYKMKLIGSHNMQNIEAARKVCRELGISDKDFYEAAQDFKGAAKRLQYRGARGGSFHVYQDFAHAPSKVQATCSAVKEWYADQKLYVFFELHTYSSLNAEFLPLYKNTLQKADKAYVVYDEHTLMMKKMPPLDPIFVKDQFDHPDLEVVSRHADIATRIHSLPKDGNLLMMSSGTFGGLDWDTVTD